MTTSNNNNNNNNNNGTNDDGEDASYIDYETFLAPDFSPSAFANTLVLATNNPNDAPLDLSTPLSRVLFDIQEIDSHIDLLTTRSAVPLLTHTKEQTEASKRIAGELDSQIKALNDSYKQLEKEVVQKHAEAEEVRQVASRLWETLKLGRAVGRCLQLGRQLEVQHAELIGSSSSSSSSSSTSTTNTTTTTSGTPSSSSSSSSSSARKEDHRALIRCTQTLLSLRELLATSNVPGAEGFGLHRVIAVRALRTQVSEPVERAVRETAERIVREFSLGTTGTGATFAQVEETRARTVSALTALYLLSPSASASSSQGSGEKWTPVLMLRALETYLRTALQSSVAGVGRALTALPGLDRALAETAARCQNIVALEAVLASTPAPPSPSSLARSERVETTTTTATTATTTADTLLQPLLAHLETGSLASYFWRSMAGSLAPRVQDLVSRGGVSARTLRSNRAGVGDAVRECVVRGSQLPSAVAAGTKGKSGEADRTGGGNWEREVAVMVGAVVGNLGR